MQYRQYIVIGFQNAIKPVPITFLNQLTQPLVENSDDFVYSKVFRPVLERCQSSFLTVPGDNPLIAWRTTNDRISARYENDSDSDAHVTARDESDSD